MTTSIADALQTFANNIKVQDAPAAPAPQPKTAPPKKQPLIYHLTSPKFSGFVLFEFNADGFLIRFDLSNAQLDETQTTFILHKLPKSIESMLNVLGKSKGVKLEPQKAKEVTFEMFWEKYNNSNSSKKKARVCWARMSQPQRDLAYNFIDKYFKSIPAGIAKKYAETYLNAEQWNN